MHGSVNKGPRTTESNYITMLKLSLVLILALLDIGYNVTSLGVTVSVDSIAPSNGSDVVFNCAFTLENGEYASQIAWSIGQSLKRATRIAHWLPGTVYNYPGFSDAFYQMNADNVGDGQVILTINPVRLHDEGNYWCELFPVGGADPQDDNITLMVTVPPTNVQITSDDNDEFKDGDELQILLGTSSKFICNTRGVNPAATLTWTLNGNVSPSQQVNTRNNDLFDSQSMYTLQAEKNNHEKQLKCTSSSTPPADHVVVDTAVNLYVQVPPTADTVALYDSSPYNSSMSGHVRQDVEHTFHCNVMGTRPKVVITWSKESQHQVGETLVKDNGNLVDTFGTLKITPSRNDHRRILKCDADININGVSVVTKQLTLDVYGPPDAPVLSGNTDLTEHILSDDLTCTASNAYPSGGSITWYSGTNQIQKGSGNSPNGSRFDIVDTLRFTPVRQDNNKMLKCEVRHMTLTSQPYLQINTTINVKFCPERITIMECPSVAVGQHGELSCKSSSSNPKISLEWYEGDGNVINTHQMEYAESDYFGFDSTLQYNTRDMKREDYNTTNFKCCAINTVTGCPAPMCTDACQLNILYPPEDVSITKSTDDGVNEGSNITLTCKAGGNPEPFTFKWHRDGSPIPGDTSSILTYQTISRYDAGIYSCTAGNEVSPDKKSLTSTVPVYYPATIDMESEIRGVDPGDDITLKCVAHGLPNPEIRWIHPQGYDISNGTERMAVSTNILKEDNVHGTIIDGQLMIDSVSSSSDYGVYRCEASNSLGGPDVFFIHINGTTAPKAVTNLAITSSSIITLTITWTPGYSGGDNLDQWFIIDYRKYTNGEAGEWSVEKKVTDGSDRYVVSDLDQDTTYDIRVFSENEVGRNPVGEKIQGKTDYITPEKPPLPIGLIVGASIGGSVLLIIIVVLLFYLLQIGCFKPKSKAAGTSGFPLKESINSNGIGQETNVNALDETSKAALYAVPDKSKKTKKEKAPIYAQVNKSKDSGSEETNGKNSGHDNKQFSKEDESAYDDVANVNPSTSDSNGKTTNPDGLIYQEVGHFTVHPEDKPPIQTEESTEYAALDFNRMKSGEK